ncbi:MAG: NDP-hexose 3,4-dehydratase, partial [Parcubacteria group bacterium Gr01-1014_56]
TETVWLAFPLVITEKAPFSRLELVTFLESKRIQTRPVFTGNILKQPGFKNIPHRPLEKQYPHTENIMRNAFVIGCHQGMTREQITYIKSTFLEFLSQYS